MHRQVRAAWKASRGPFITSVAVLTEVSDLLVKYIGPDAEVLFLESCRAGQVRVEQVTDRDLSRVIEILREYSDKRFGFVDAALFALAERLGLEHVLTLDRRHFDAFRPRHCRAWRHVLAQRA